MWWCCGDVPCGSYRVVVWFDGVVVMWRCCSDVVVLWCVVVCGDMPYHGYRVVVWCGGVVLMCHVVVTGWL